MLHHSLFGYNGIRGLIKLPLDLRMSHPKTLYRIRYREISYSIIVSDIVEGDHHERKDFP